MENRPEIDFSSDARRHGIVAGALITGILELGVRKITSLSPEIITLLQEQMTWSQTITPDQILAAIWLNHEVSSIFLSFVATSILMIRLFDKTTKPPEVIEKID